MASHLRGELVLDALEMAIGQRRPGDVIHHSDQGSQCTFSCLLTRQNPNFPALMHANPCAKMNVRGRGAGAAGFCSGVAGVSGKGENE